MPFLKTELVITDCREITRGENGHATVGDIVNAQIGDYLNTPGRDGPPPRPQSITIGWETEGDWYTFASDPGNREMYPAPSNRKARSIAD